VTIAFVPFYHGLSLFLATNQQQNSLSLLFCVREVCSQSTAGVVECFMAVMYFHSALP